MKSPADEQPRVFVANKKTPSFRWLPFSVLALAGAIALILWLSQRRVFPQQPSVTVPPAALRLNETVSRSSETRPAPAPVHLPDNGSALLPKSGAFTVNWNTVTLIRPDPSTEFRTMELECFCTHNPEQRVLEAIMSHGVLWSLRTDLGPEKMMPQNPGVPQRTLQATGRGNIRLIARIPASASKIEALTAVVRALYAKDRHVFQWKDLTKDIGAQQSSDGYQFTLTRFSVENDIASAGIASLIPRGTLIEPDYWADYLTDYRLIATDGTAFTGASGGMFQKTAAYPLNGKTPARYEVSFVTGITQESCGFALADIPLPPDCPVPTAAFVTAHPPGEPRRVQNGYAFTLENINQVASLDTKGLLRRKTVFTFSVILPGNPNILGVTSFLPSTTGTDIEGKSFRSDSYAGSMQTLDGQSARIQAIFESLGETAFLNTLAFRYSVFVADQRETVLIPLTRPDEFVIRNEITREPVEHVGNRMRIGFHFKSALVASLEYGSCGFKYDVLGKNGEIIPTVGSEWSNEDGITHGAIFLDATSAMPATLRVRFPSQGHVETIPVTFNNIYLRLSAPDLTPQKQF